MIELQRYGLEWKSDTDFIATPMSDGHWTPWHIAQERLATTQAENEALRAQLRETEAKGRILMDMCRDLKARVSELERTGSTSTACPFCFDQMRNSYILRKQAEVVEDMWDKVNPDNPGRSLRDEAQRLRAQAAEIEKEVKQ